MEFSCTLSAASGFPLEQRFIALREGGCSRANLSVSDTIRYLSAPQDAEVFSKQLKEANLAVDWVHAPYYGTPIHSQSWHRRRMAVASMVRHLEGAGEIEARVFVCHALAIDPKFNMSEDMVPPEEIINREGDIYKNIVESIHTLVDLGKRIGVSVAIENMRNLYVLKAAEYLMEDIPDLAFCYDVGHSFLNPEIIPRLTKYADRLAAVHLHDNGGINDDHWFPSEGLVDWESVMSTLQQLKYQGVYGMEVHWHNIPTPEETANRIRKSIDRIRRAQAIGGVR